MLKIFTEFFLENGNSKNSTCPCWKILFHFEGFPLTTWSSRGAFTISHNSIEHFTSGQYRNWPSLRLLDVSFNRLTSLPVSLLTKTPLLEDLSLAGTPFLGSFSDVRISSVLSELPRLRLLNLDECGISRINQQTLGVWFGNNWKQLFKSGN